MSFTINYTELFKIRVLEAVTNNPIEDLHFFPTQECLENLKDHRLILKQRNSGVDIFYAQNPEALNLIMAPISQRTRFGFGFSIGDPSFFKKYDPDLTNPAQFYLDNLDNAGNILPGALEVLSENAVVDTIDATRVYGRTFTVTTDLTVAPAPNDYRINEKFNPANTLQTVAIDNPLGLNVVTTKLNDPYEQVAEYIKDSGPYLLESDTGQPATSTIYLDDQLVKKNATGIVDIYWENSQGTAAPGGNIYQIIFSLK